MPDAIKRLDKQTPQDVIDVAFSVRPPRDLQEASAAIRYLETRKQLGISAETEAKRAALAFEAGTGTLAHIRRIARNIPEYSTRASIELERGARRAIGGTVRGLYHDIFGPTPQPVYPPAPETLAQRATAEIQRRRSGRPQTA